LRKKNIVSHLNNEIVKPFTLRYRVIGNNFVISVFRHAIASILKIT